MIDLPHSSNCSSASEAMCQFFDERGYPVSVIQADHHRAQLKLIDSQYHERLRRKTRRIPFTLSFHPHNRAVKSIILKNFRLLQNDSETGTMFSQPPLTSFKRDKNRYNFLVRSSFQTNDQPYWNFQMRSLTMQNFSFYP